MGETLPKRVFIDHPNLYLLSTLLEGISPAPHDVA